MDGKQRSVKPIMPSKPFKPTARMKRAKGSTNRDDGAGVRLAMTVICIIAVVMVTVYFIGAQISPASGKTPDENGGGIAGGDAADSGTEYDAAEKADTPGTDVVADEAEDTGADTDFKVYISFDIAPDTADDVTSATGDETTGDESDVTGDANITDDTTDADTAEPEVPAAPMEPETPGEMLPMCLSSLCEVWAQDTARPSRASEARAAQPLPPRASFRRF